MHACMHMHDARMHMHDAHTHTHIHIHICTHAHTCRLPTSTYFLAVVVNQFSLVKYKPPQLPVLFE